ILRPPTPVIPRSTAIANPAQRLLMRCISLLPLLVAGTRNLSLTTGVVKMRVLFSGALTQIIVGFYPDFKPWRPSRRGTVLHMGFTSRSRVLVLGLVLAAIAWACGGCDGAGRGARAAQEGGDSTTLTSTTPTPPATPTARSITKAFDSVRKRFAGDIVGICMGAIDQQTRAIKCYGRVSPGSKQKPSRTTLFQIGSLSKTFTATLLALR